MHEPENQSSLRAVAAGVKRLGACHSEGAERPRNLASPTTGPGGPPLQRWGRESVAPAWCPAHTGGHAASGTRAYLRRPSGAGVDRGTSPGGSRPRLLTLAPPGLSVGVLLLALAGCRAAPTRPAFGVRLAGAQIATELVASWLGDAEECRFAVEQVGPVYLSQHGFQNLRDRNCDLACTDRMITPREQDEFGGRELKGYRIAFYGYGLYVHPDNPLDSIYAEHLKLLFQRTLTDWRELGTPYEGPIRLVGPEKSTRGGMILMRQADIWLDKPTWEPLESDLAIIDAVAADPYVLGSPASGSTRTCATWVCECGGRTRRPFRHWRRSSRSSTDWQRLSTCTCPPRRARRPRRRSTIC